MPWRAKASGGGEKAPLLSPTASTDTAGLGPRPASTAEDALAPRARESEYDAVTLDPSAAAATESEWRRSARKSKKKRGKHTASYSLSAGAPEPPEDAGVTCESALYRNRNRRRSVTQRVSRFFGLEDGDMPMQVAVRASKRSSASKGGAAPPLEAGVGPGADDDGGITAIDDGEYALASPEAALAAGDEDDKPKEPSKSAPYFHGPLTAEDAKERMKVRMAVVATPPGALLPL